MKPTCLKTAHKLVSILSVLLLIVVLIPGCSKNASSLKSPTTPSGSTDTTKKDVPANAMDGVTFVNNGTAAIFNLYAPGKTSVYVIGDFNNWQVSDQYKMTNSTDGSRWWIQVDGLTPTSEYGYQFVINGTLKVGDPYAQKILDPVNDQYIPATVYPGLKAYPTGKTTGIVSVMQAQPVAYNWKVTDFKRPDPDKLVIYELLVRDFIATHDYKTLTDTLDYIARLGVNAIELLPVNEFEGNDSWGYNTNYMFALDKYYGTPNDYRAFIDACHLKGIAVIQDIVLEDQFGSSPMVQMYATASGSPSADNPWFDTQNMHPSAVGYQLNHESAATKYYTKNVIKYWMQQYHIDGYRFDQAKGFTQVPSTDDAGWSAYDPSRVAIWKDYNNYMKSLDPTFYVILEYFASAQEQSELAAQGMMIWQNMSFNAQQAGMGYNDAGGSWDLSYLSYKLNQYSAPGNQVSYFESHDEERIQFKNFAYGNADSSGSYAIKGNLPTGLKRDELLAAFLFATPGPKMLWEFGERGYDISIGTDDQRLQDKPPHWEYMADNNRAHLYNVYAQMIKMKVSNDVFNTSNYSYSLNGAVKYVELIGADGTDVIIVGNFDVSQQTVTLNFPVMGTWVDNLGITPLTVSSAAQSLTLAPGEYHVYSNHALLN